VILVLGATGNTGGEVARQLIAAGERPRLLVRDPERAQEFAGRADLAVGDLRDADSLRRAMQGVDRLYLVSAGPELTELEGLAIAAAVAAGVRHVVKLSVITADAPGFLFGRWHQESERRLMDSGLAWTMLRPSNFMTHALLWAATVRAQGAIFQPTGTGRWAMIDPADIAAVAVRALTTPGHEGRAYALTGRESRDGAGYARLLSEALGRPVAYVDVPPAAAREAMRQAGIPPAYLEAIMDLFAAMKAGLLDIVTDDVERLLGRPPATFLDWARRHTAAFG
jgi:(4-alkanoyl-5-oxo-2,5-dihydrofuran-3-yl)methyl phosphate reductase